MSTLPLSFLIAAAGLVLLSIKRIPEGQAYTVYRFGRYRRTLAAGVHWIVPLVERVAHRVSLTGRALAMAPTVLTVGERRVEVDGKVYFQVLDAARADPEADHLDDVVLTALVGALRGPVLCAALAAAPGDLNATLKRTLNAALAEHGIVVTRCRLVPREPDAGSRHAA
jgi:regulator of protease activity HflC (stomatin/prohibitin superfamily)